MPNNKKSVINLKAKKTDKSLEQVALNLELSLF
jgi:hypothetical protein